MSILAERLFSSVSADLRFYVAPDEQSVAVGNELVLQEQLPVRHPVSEVYRFFNDFPELNLADIDADPVIQAARELSPALLLSLFRLSSTDMIAAHILKDDSRFPHDLREQFQKKTEDLEIITDGYQSGKPDKLAQSLAHYAYKGRDILLRLTAPELLAKEGLQLHRDFLSPLKMMEMSIGYDPHIATVESRAAGLQIPYQIRSLSGNLRLAQQARAQDSMISVMVQEYQHMHIAHAHFLNIIRNRVATATGAVVDYQKHTLTSDAEISPQTLTEFAHSDPVFTLMRAIAKRDFMHLGDTWFDGERDHMEIGEVESLEQMGDLAFETAMMMVDPSVSDFGTQFPEIEASLSHGLSVPYGFLYHYNQSYLLLRPRALNTKK